MIDTPGMRELQLWNADGGVSETFTDIEEFATRCYFKDCRHESEPGCEVIRALEDGEIDLKRMENYRKMRKELDYLHRRQDQSAIIAEKTKWKSIHKELKHFKKG